MRLYTCTVVSPTEGVPYEETISTIPTVDLTKFGVAMDRGAPWPRTIECHLLGPKDGNNIIGHVNLVFSKNSAKFLHSALGNLVDSKPTKNVTKKKVAKKKTPAKRKGHQ